MNAHYLHPMTAMEIIANAFRVYRDHLALLVLVALLPHLVLLGLETLVLIGGEPSAGVFFAGMIAIVVMNGIALAAITVAICRSVVIGEEPSVTQTYALTLRGNLPMVILAYLAINMLVSTGFMFFVLIMGLFPGALFGTALSLLLGGIFAPTIPIVVVERKRAIEALSRSISLMRGELLKGMVVFGFFIGVAGLLPLLTLFMQSGIGIGPFTPLLGAIIGSVTLPLGFAANVLLYLSLRSHDGDGGNALQAELKRFSPE